MTEDVCKIPNGCYKSLLPVVGGVDICTNNQATNHEGVIKYDCGRQSLSVTERIPKPAWDWSTALEMAPETF
eukprot:scaffold5287_cov113-Chaetoceros_neogracile.AAC.1